MKKINVWIIAAFIAAAVVAGCGSAPAAATTEAPPAQAAAPGAQAAAPATSPSQAAPTPPWLGDLPPEDAFWGIGAARATEPTTAMQLATQAAQRDVAQQLGTLVQAQLINHSREAGTLNNPSTTRFIDNITRSLVNKNLTGATPNARTQTPDGTWWVRVSLKKADAKRAINDSVTSEAAQVAEFNAMESLKMLEAEVEKTQSKPLVIFEEKK